MNPLSSSQACAPKLCDWALQSLLQFHCRLPASSGFGRERERTTTGKSQRRRRRILGLKNPFYPVFRLTVIEDTSQEITTGQPTAAAVSETGSRHLIHCLIRGRISVLSNSGAPKKSTRLLVLFLYSSRKATIGTQITCRERDLQSF